MKKLSVILLVVMGVAFAGFAEAATPKKRTRNANRIGPYAGALLSQASFSGDQSGNEQFLRDILTGAGVPIQNLSSSTEESDIGYQAMFGYRFNRYVAAELGLAQFGSLISTARADMDFGEGLVPVSVKSDFAVSGPVFSAIGVLPINDKLEVYGRLGYLFANTERELSANVDGESGSLGSASGSSQNPVYGIGFAWNINQVYSIRGEYQKLTDLGQDNRTGTEDMTVIGIGLIVRF